ncbi:MAG: tetratricopeptide repeat protein [Deltaproteobacteria bacterium]|nr:tetratricopeptide repeat protein [Deltaproteobacteria bacterium]
MRRALRSLLLLGLLLPLALPAPGGAAPGVTGDTLRRIEQRVRLAEHLFDTWQFDAAVSEAEGLYREHPGLPPVQRIAGIAKFHRQDYDGAIALLERAGAGRPEGVPPDPMLVRARDTREITRDYRSYRSDHFELRVPAGVDEVLPRYALPALEQAWKNVGDDFGYHPEVPIVVEAYERPTDLSAASGLSTEAIKTSGTIAICKYNKLMFTSPKALLRGYEWLDTLSHEYVHYVISRVSKNTVPIWLHEGIAKYEETRWSGSAGQALSPSSERLLAEAVAGKRKYITFEEMSPSMALLPSQEATALAFAEVFSLIQYLVEARGGYPKLRELIGLLTEGQDDRSAVRQVLGQTFEQLQRDWKLWLKERPMKARPGVHDTDLTFKEDVKGKVAESAEEEGDPTGELQSKEAKRFAHLGELLRIEGRPKAAVVEYEKAYGLAGPVAVHLANKLGRTHTALGNLARAEEILEEAREASPALVTTHVNLGRLYLGAKRWDEALASYRRATEINPFDPEVHRALSMIHTHRGEGDDVRAELAAFELTRTRIETLRRQRSQKQVADEELGFLSIHTTPWAEVRIDGKSEGLTTPIFRRPLPPGEHALVFRIGGRKVGEQKVTIETARLATVELKLDPEAGEEETE